MTELNKQELEEKIIQTLKTCYDPEIPVDIFELGLIYEIGIDDKANVNIKMTLTSPACPVAGSLPPEVEGKVKAIPEVHDAKIELVWSPPWDDVGSGKSRTGIYVSIFIVIPCEQSEIRNLNM